MRIFVVDVFTQSLFGGNQAGVVMLDEGDLFPQDIFMQALARELKHSETVFFKQSANAEYQLRYFTPNGEVDFCGHATIAVFTLLKSLFKISTGSFVAQTIKSYYNINVEDTRVYISMPKPQTINSLQAQDIAELYSAFGLKHNSVFVPKIVNAGLSDIICPVASLEELNSAEINSQQVVKLSKRLNVVGVHLFAICEQDEYLAHCRNFAPLFGIEEESATGTSNAGLTHYLQEYSYAKPNIDYHIVQGEKMGNTSHIYTRITENNILVGGSAVVAIECVPFRV